MSLTTAPATPLSALVREVLEQHDVSDPRELADLVFDRLSEGEALDLLRGFLPEYCRQQMHRVQRSAMPKQGTPKWERYRDALEVYRRLECAAGVWKPIGQFTREDVTTAAVERREQAAALTQRAESFEQLAKEMRRLKAALVAEVPAERVMELLYV